MGCACHPCLGSWTPSIPGVSHLSRSPPRLPTSLLLGKVFQQRIWKLKLGALADNAAVSLLLNLLEGSVSLSLSFESVSRYHYVTRGLPEHIGQTAENRWPAQTGGFGKSSVLVQAAIRKFQRLVAETASIYFSPHWKLGSPIIEVPAGSASGEGPFLVCSVLTLEERSPLLCL